MVCIFSGNCISIGPPSVVAQDNKAVKRLHNGNTMIISIFFGPIINHLEKRGQWSQFEYFRISTVLEGWNHMTDSGTAVGKLIGENQGLPL
jgi:hypothetical protein